MRSWIARRMLRATSKRNSATDLGSRFADAVARRSADEDEHRDAIRAWWDEINGLRTPLSVRSCCPH